MKKLILLLFIGASVFVSKNVHAQKKQSEANNLKFYGRVWDVVVNEGRINILDTAFADDVVLHHT
jgi:hypothetical protein